MRVLSSLALVLCATITVAAQIKVPRLPVPRDLPLPNLDRLIRGESPITTSLKDARVEVPWLDTLRPKFADLRPLRNQRGAFALKSGHWTIDLHSFCARPGTRGPQPTDGRGYLSASLAGPHADVFKHMLLEYGRHPDISQHDMQTLIWALLSRTKIRQMSLRHQTLAARLLTPAQIAALETGALDVIPVPARRKIFSALPREVRAIAEAENRLREILVRSNHTYEELERIAVLRGPLPRDARHIPPERWSIHPDGFLIRLTPHGIARTTVELAVPGRYQVRRDGKGRIVSVDFGDGRRTETEYDDTIPAFEPPGNLMAVAYAFKSVKLIRPGAGGQPEEILLRDRGWTFVTRPTARIAPRFDVQFAAWRQPRSSIDRFIEWKERYDEWNEDYRERAEWYRDRWEHVADPPPDVEQSIRDLEDLEHYRDGIDAALRGDTGDRLDWLIDHQERMNAALERATITLDGLPDGTGSEYEPPADVALPGYSGGQRGIFSSR
jgi:hypothetical protein